MSDQHLRVSFLERICWFLFPMLLWFGLYDFGRMNPSGDNHFYFYWITYHCHYLSQGIFPLWDPFRSWGWPDLIDVRIIGAFNPLYLIIMILMSLQIPAIVAFQIFQIIFYWLGAFGLYLLVRRLCSQELPALMAYTLLILSPVSDYLYAQIAVPFTLFPTIWFFYFLISFFQSEDPVADRRYFLGLVFVIMYMAITYLPFFFLLIFFAVALTIFLKISLIATLSSKLFKFILRNKGVFILGLLLIIISCIPSIDCYLALKKGEMISLTSRNDFGNSADIIGTTLRMINYSSLAAATTISEVISGSDIGSRSESYVAMFIFIVLGVGAFISMKRWQVGVFIAGFFIFIFSLADVTMIHKFLYDHFPALGLFRNLYLLWPFLMIFLIIMAAGQFDNFLHKLSHNTKNRRIGLLNISLVHVVLLVVLMWHEGVMFSSYATVMGSWILLSLLVLGVFEKRKNFFMLGLFLVMTLQPCQVLRNDMHGWGLDGGFKMVDSRNQEFSYVRPLRGDEPHNEIEWHHSVKLMRDESGFFRHGYAGAKHSYELYSNVSPVILSDYVRYKFIVYDMVQYMDLENPDWSLVSKVIGGVDKKAIVDDKSFLTDQESGLSGREKSTKVHNASDEIRVVDFNPNSITIATNFPSRKFLVYNDSYYPGWKVFVDGVSSSLAQANIAFKGVWVDKGPHSVEFKFGSFTRYVIVWGLTGIYLVFFLYVIFIFLRDRK